MTKVTNIPGRLHSVEQGNIVVGANEVYDDTKGKKQNVINSETDAELLRLEQTKQDNLMFDNAPTENSNNPVKSGGVYAADLALQQAIEAILLLIPSAATAVNQLADKAFVNSSISTATATFRGTYNVVTDLHLAVDATHAQIEAALASVVATADNNDYCYVQIPVSSSSQDIQKTSRYKFNGTAWVFEYDLNTSGFTSAQWAAINSGITLALVGKRDALPTAVELAAQLETKQNVLTFDDAPTQGSNNPVKSGGIYTAIKGITDLLPAEATALNQLADKAYVLGRILAATPAFKGQFTSLVDLQAVQDPKASDLGIVRTTDSDGYAVFTFYQYLNNQWNVFYTLSHHNQKKPATTGTTGDYPYNGMGRIVLEKDVDFKTQVEAVTGGNTIFVICYDFTLTSDAIIPANCILEFEGGSIKGRTLTGNGTAIKSDSSYVIFKDIAIAGTWLVDNSYSKWFESSDETVYSTIDNLMAMLSENITNNVYIVGSYDYQVKRSYGEANLKSNTNIFINGSITKVGTKDEKNIFEGAEGIHNVLIRGGSIIGNAEDTDTSSSTSLENGCGVFLRSCKDIMIDGVTFYHHTGDGITLSHFGVSSQPINENIYIVNCTFDNNSRTDIAAICCKNLVVENCIFKNFTRRTNPGTCVDLEPNYDFQTVDNVIFRNCVFDNCLNGIFFALRDNIEYNNAIIENCMFINCARALGGRSLNNFIIRNN